MQILSSLQRLTVRQSLLLTGMFLTASCAFALQQTVAVREMKENGLPAALAIPAIEKRLGVLTEQAELAQFQASVSGGSEEEILHVYVLPDSSQLERLLTTFDVFFDHLKDRKQLASFSALEVGESEPTHIDGVQAIPVTFSADLTKEGLSQLLAFIRIAGLLTIHDVLTEEETNSLLHLTEQENPAAIVALEQFLSTDLLRYSEEPSVIEGQLLKSFASPEFEEAFRAILHSSRMQETQQLLSDLQHVLHSKNLWPLRFLMLDHIDVTYEGERVLVKVRVKAFVR